MSTVLLLEGPDGNRYTAWPHVKGWVINPFTPLSPVMVRKEYEWWANQTVGYHWNDLIVISSLKEFTILAASPGNYNAHSITFF